MRSTTLGGKITRQIKNIQETAARWADNLIARMMFGLSGRQWTASFLIGLLLLPAFSLPVQAAVVFNGKESFNSGDFEPVNPPQHIWETTWKKFNVAFEEWETARRPAGPVFENVHNSENAEKTKLEKFVSENSKDVVAENPLAEAKNDVKISEKINADNSKTTLSLAGNSEKKEKQSAAALNNRSSTLTADPVAKAAPMPTPRPMLDDAQIPQLVSPRNNLGSPMGQDEAASTYPALATLTREKAGIGNFGFDVPVASLPGRGLDASVSVSYNSQLWTRTVDENGESTMTFNIDGNEMAPGFQLGYGYLDFYSAPGQGNSYLLTEINGTRHQLKYSSAASRYQTNDGSFIDIASQGGVTTAIYTDGTRVAYGPQNSERRRYPVKITDRHGNFINIAYTDNYSGRFTKITDTLGREIQFHYNNVDQLIAVTVPAFDGGTTRRQTIRFYYESLTLQTSGRFNTNYVDAPQSASVLRYIYFPGTKTGFRYDYSQYYGMIHKINRLEGMQVVGDSLTQMGSVVTTPGSFLESASTCYNYPDSPCSPGNYLPTGDVPKFNYRFDDWVGRTGSVPQTQFSQTSNLDSNGSGTSTMTVTMPDGTKNVSVSNVRPPSSSGVADWEDGLTTENYTIGLGRTAANPWTRAVIKWQVGNSTIGRRNARIEHIKTTNDIGQVKATVYGYDNYNNQTLITEHDFAPATQIGTELRRTEIKYETNSQWTGFNRLVRLPLSVKKKVGGVYVSRTDYRYDGFVLADTPGIIQYDGSYNVSTAGYDCNCEWVCSVNRDEYGYCPYPGTESYMCHDTCYSYNPQTVWRGNVTKIINFSNPNVADEADESADSNAVVNTFKYDIVGNRIESAGLSCCGLKKWTYDAANKYAYMTAELRTGEGGLETKTEYNFYTGLVTKTINENNQPTDYEYESDTLRQKKVIYPNNGYTQTEYSDKLISSATQLVPGFSRTTTTLEANKTTQSYDYYDARGLPLRTAALTPNGWSVSATEYDNFGRPKKSFNPFYVGAANDAIPNGTKYTEILSYDAVGGATQIRLQDNTTVSTFYNEAAVTFNDPDGLSRTGTASRVKDQADKERRQIVDALGRIIRVDEPDVMSNGIGTAGSPTQPTHYYYDGNDNLSRVAQIEGTVRQTREFSYDALSRLTKERQVEADRTLNDAGQYGAADPNRWTKVFKYDTFSLLRESWDARGVKTTFSYDDLNRIETVTFSDGTPTVTYTYDQTPTGFYNKGALIRIETAQGGTSRPDTPSTATEFDYDKMGRVIKHRQSIGTQTYNQEYSYNLAGQLTSQTYPSGKAITYGYDAGGRLSTIADVSRTYLNSIGYVGTGNKVNSFILGNSTGQGFAYNDRLQLMTQTLTNAGGTLQQYYYGYGQTDQNGNLDITKNNGQMAKVESYIGTTKQWTQKFRYDVLSRLSEAEEYKGTTTTLSYKQKFDFDRFGNLYRKASSNQAAGQESPLPYTAVEDANISKSNNRYLSNTTYDNAGNITQDTKFRNLKFAYDANGRTIKTSTTDDTNQADSVYDANGQRVAVKTYDAWKFFIYDASGKLVSEYGGVLAVDEGGVKYAFTDWQGSTRAVISNTGLIQARQDFTAFGEEVGANVGLRTTAQGYGANNNLNQKYALTERDQASGLDHTGWRKLENRSGRWTSPDPYSGSFSLNNPQSFNRYTYVGNDPVNLVDPTGLYEACVHAAMTRFLAKLAGGDVAKGANQLADAAGDKKDYGADSSKYSAASLINAVKGLFFTGPSRRIHFASQARLRREIGNFNGYIQQAEADPYHGYQNAGFVLHSIQDVDGAHDGFSLPGGHAVASILSAFGIGNNPDRVIGDERFMRAANETLQTLTGDKNRTLTAEETNKLIDAIKAECGKSAKKFKITRPLIIINGVGYPWWFIQLMQFLNWTSSIRVRPRQIMM